MRFTDYSVDKELIGLLFGHPVCKLTKYALHIQDAWLVDWD